MNKKTDMVVMKWSIHNFSSWHGEIHDTMMTTAGFEAMEEDGITLELFPRGLSGREENLVVNIKEITPGIRGDLVFVASDGHIFCQREVNGERARGGILEHILGPKFDAVCARIWESERDLITTTGLSCAFAMRISREQVYVTTCIPQ